MTNCIMRSFITFTLRHIQVQEGEMGRACSTNGGEEECIYDTCRKARMKEATKNTKI
jgi:hypothetical protein